MIIESEDVKQAIAERLLELFPEVNVYKEAKTNVLYPHFFIYQVNFMDEKERKDHFILYYMMEVRYRVAADPSTDLTLQRDLDKIALKLLQGFDIIDMEDEKVWCTDKSIEKSDGVLLFTMTIAIMVKKVSGEEGAKQNTLSVKMENLNANIRS